jgi:hypothetical protein
MMVDGSKRDMSIELFGMMLSTPIFMVSIGVIGPRSKVELTGVAQGFLNHHGIAPHVEGTRRLAGEPSTQSQRSCRRAPPFFPRSQRSNKTGRTAIAASPCGTIKCESRDLNPDPLRDWILSPARLPIPPLSRGAAKLSFRSEAAGVKSGERRVDSCRLSVVRPAALRARGEPRAERIPRRTRFGTSRAVGRPAPPNRRPAF